MLKTPQTNWTEMFLSSRHKMSGIIVLFVLLSIWLVGDNDRAFGQETKIPDPDSMTLETRDGVELRCTWYAGTLGKETVPIIMLHGWDGVRGDYSGLATYLQGRGYAVMVPDLRGHGRSKRVRGSERDLPDRDKWRKEQIATIANDVERVKQFLLERNNEGELNINMLCLVAAEEMAVIAIKWAVQDWSYPQLLGRPKQGQDVKALVLLSPHQSFKGLTTTAELSNELFRGRGSFPPLSIMIISGSRDRESTRIAGRIYSSLQRTREKPEENLKGRDVYRKMDLHLITPNTALQGAKLVDPGIRLDMEREVRDFIRYRLAERDDEFPWTSRGEQP